MTGPPTYTPPCKTSVTRSGLSQTRRRGVSKSCYSDNVSITGCAATQPISPAAFLNHVCRFHAISARLPCAYNSPMSTIIVAHLVALVRSSLVVQRTERPCKTRLDYLIVFVLMAVNSRQPVSEVCNKHRNTSVVVIRRIGLSEPVHVFGLAGSSACYKVLVPAYPNTRPTSS